MMTCREASRWISQELDASLPMGRRIALRIHVGLCGACRAYRRDLRALAGWLREHAGRVEEWEEALEVGLAPADRERIARALAEAAR
ncbi:MAG: zf-HC2 domain-containing protein [Candidatus Dadabacteria bacterium]|nr:MAG: zf-HC2 domain-containing protein [Candidatus Dadabacteria bacterium]